MVEGGGKHVSGRSQQWRSVTHNYSWLQPSPGVRQRRALGLETDPCYTVRQVKGGARGLREFSSSRLIEKSEKIKNI